MNVQINGELRELPSGCTAQQLLVNLGMQGKRVALEINLEIVPRSQYHAHVLRDGDRVEVVHAIGGG